MDVEIRALSPALAGDYMRFFQNDAFTDHPEWAGCNCMHFHWDAPLEAAFAEFAKSDEKENLRLFRRCWAEELVRNGTIQGYLAYSDGRAVGWCNANDKVNFAALRENVKPELWTDEEPGRVKSIVCFCIAPAMRGRGIAAKLLTRVCEDAKEQGYECLEAYPRAGSRDIYVNHHGPDELYYKQGFTLQKVFEGQAVVRKYL